MKRFIQFAILLFVIIFLLKTCKQGVSSHFKTDAEGWTIVGDAQSGDVEPVYFAEGGVKNGFIHAEDDVAGGVWYFSAPEAYLGNKKSFYGKTLYYSLFQKPTADRSFDDADIIIASDNNKIYFVVDNYPDTTWTHYKVKIDADANWYDGNYSKSGKRATADQIKSVLSNVTKFWIRGEYRTGPDNGGLDEVKIK